MPPERTSERANKGANKGANKKARITMATTTPPTHSLTHSLTHPPHRTQPPRASQLDRRRPPRPPIASSPLDRRRQAATCCDSTPLTHGCTGPFDHLSGGWAIALHHRPTHSEPTDSLRSLRSRRMSQTQTHTHT